MTPRDTQPAGIPFSPQTVPRTHGWTFALLAPIVATSCLSTRTTTQRSTEIGEVQPMGMPEPMDAPSPAPASPASAAPRRPRSADELPAVEPSVPTPWPLRGGAPGDTTGTVSCGSQRCTAVAQGCVLDQEARGWKCVPTGCDPRAPKPCGIGFACDDGRDCPDGFTCCRRWYPELDESSVCVARHDVALQCRDELCVPGGARCPAGSTCIDDDVWGSCQPPRGPATCARRQPCPTDRPVCALTTAGPECVAAGSPEWRATEGSQRFECTLQSDCHGGETCSYVFGEGESEVATYCARYNSGFMGTLVCDPGGPSSCHDSSCAVCKPVSAELPWLGAVVPG